MTAREKIVNEMNALNDKNRNRSSIERIGEHLLDMLPSAEIEEKILVEGKTLKGAVQAMEDYARKMNSSSITDDEGFGVMRGYFGITDKKNSFTSDVDDLFD